MYAGNTTFTAYESVDKKNCSGSFYYDNASGLCKPTCGVQNGNKDTLVYVFVPIGMFGYIVAFITACFNHRIM